MDYIVLGKTWSPANSLSLYKAAIHLDTVMLLSSYFQLDDRDILNESFGHAVAVNCWKPRHP